MESSSLSKFDCVMFLLYAYFFGVCTTILLHDHIFVEPQKQHISCSQGQVVFSLILPDDATCIAK